MQKVKARSLRLLLVYRCLTIVDTVDNGDSRSRAAQHVDIMLSASPPAILQFAEILTTLSPLDTAHITPWDACGPYRQGAATPGAPGPQCQRLPTPHLQHRCCPSHRLKGHNHGSRCLHLLAWLAGDSNARAARLPACAAQSRHLLRKLEACCGLKHAADSHTLLPF